MLRGIAMAAMCTVAVSSCITNDLPYPRIQPNFLTFEVKGESRVANIDSASATVTVFLTEEANIRGLEVTNYSITPGCAISDASMTLLANPLDLSEPKQVVLSLYQDYTWNIRAIQEISRYFTVANQVGSSEIDVDNHTVSAVVPDVVPLSAVQVLSMKLAGPEATYSPAMVGESVDFTQPVVVDVTEHGITTQWTITIAQTATKVFIEPADAWTNVAWLYGSAEVGKTNGFEYRVAGAEEWIVVPQEWITHDGGSFTARLIHLLPQTTYEARATSDEDTSIVVQFTTGSIEQLPNSQFEEWCYVNNRTWYPWADASQTTGFWGTGNKGSTYIGSSNVTTPISDIMSLTGYRGAHLEAKVIAGIKFAAGNMFAGDFKRVVGTDGVLDFGQPFTERPTSLSTRIKFHSTPITRVSTSNPDLTNLRNQPDMCIVWCALIDSDTPYEIRTQKSNRQLFDKDGDCVIAYGEFSTDTDIDEYTDITIPLTYKSYSRKPKYLLVVASTSKYGDYYTGGPGSTLDILHFTLNYDY